MSFRNRYFIINRINAGTSIETAISSLEDLLGQEFEAILSNGSFEVEGMNTISCPSHFVKLASLISSMKEFSTLLKSEEFASFVEKEST